jgi:septum formation protein
MKIILGSSSPRRKTILQNLIDEFEIINPDVKEAALDGETPIRFSERISKEKAGSILKNNSKNSGSLIISCDTIVTIDNRIIGKPINFQDAVNILKILSGKTHEVISSITLVYSNGSKSKNITDSEVSRITFKSIIDEEIIKYLKKIDYMDKAGAYAIQEYGSSLIESIDGSVTNVIGFPVRLFFRMLTKLNLIKETLL